MAAISHARQVADQLLDGEVFGAIYCVGAMTDVDGCESAPELAMAVNRDGPQIIAKMSALRDIPFVYFSSDYVFDGRAGPYAEDDIPNPICTYGRSKHEGELSVLAANPRTLIVRTTVVFGPDRGRKNFLYGLSRRIAERQSIRTADDQVSTPTYNRDLATATVALVDQGATGIFHVSGPEKMSRTDFARRAATAMCLDSAVIQPAVTAELGQRASRPLRAGLRIDKLLRTLPAIRMHSVEEAIADWKPWLEASA